MNYLKRVRHKDVLVSDLLFDLSLQTFQAGQSGQIDQKTADALLIVFNRCHTSLCVRRSIFARSRQKRYNKRHLIKWDSDFMFTLACGIAFGIALAAAWLITQ